MTNYWEKLYSRGGNSGSGSVGPLRDWKWRMLLKYCAYMDHVIDFGCGDLSFWSGIGCKDYTGIEQSDSRVRLNTIKRPDLSCVCMDASDKRIPEVIPTSPTVICFDMLFHVMDEDAYVRILENLSDCSSEYIFVYTWDGNPFETIAFVESLLTQTFRWNWDNARKMLTCEYRCTDYQYQYYREFLSYAKHLKNHNLVGVEHPALNTYDPYGAMFIFRRKP